jgi:integrase/recombinase XerD
LIPERVTDFTSAPKMTGDLPKALTDEEVLRLLAYEDNNYRNMVIFELFLDTGLRLAEVANLELKDIHLSAGWAMVMGKGSKQAIVPLGKKLMRDLYIYVHQYRKPASDDVQALFLNPEGEALGREGIAILVRRALAHVGVEGKHGAHTLRHTFATNFLRNGGSLEALRRILRHSDIKITSRYIHLLSEDMVAEHRRASPLDKIRR